MSYDVVNPTYYQTFQPGTPFHPGAPGWTEAPFPTWGENPNLAGRRRLATDGLGNVVAISGLGGIIKSSDPGFVCPADAPHREIESRSGVTCYGEAEWAALQRQRGATVSPATVSPTTTSLSFPAPLPPWLRALSTISAAACAYHGYKRNESVGWAFGWAFFGSVAPFFALPVALAQGFGKPRHRPAMAPNRRRRRRTRR